MTFPENTRVQFVGNPEEGYERGIVGFRQGKAEGFKGTVIESDDTTTLVRWDLIPGFTCQITHSSLPTQDLISLEANAALLEGLESAKTGTVKDLGEFTPYVIED